MWLSTALLPCCEVTAAGQAQEQALHPADCTHPGEQVPGSGDGNKAGVCLGIAAPAPAAAERLAAPRGYSPSQPVSGMYLAFPTLHAPPAIRRPVAHQAAPPPDPAFLRNSRLLL